MGQRDLTGPAHDDDEADAGGGEHHDQGGQEQSEGVEQPGSGNGQGDQGDDPRHRQGAPQRIGRGESGPGHYTSLGRALENSPSGRAMRITTTKIMATAARLPVLM